MPKKSISQPSLEDESPLEQDGDGISALDFESDDSLDIE